MYWNLADIKEALGFLISHWWIERQRADARARQDTPEPKQSSVTISGTINGFKFEGKEYDTTTDAALTKLLASMERAKREIDK